MEIKIRINLDNAAFDDNPDELAEVLGQIPYEVGEGDGGKLVDSNGNTVGRWFVSEETK